MDQLPLEFNLTMLVKDLDELLTFLETDKDKWGWLVEELNEQFTKQICW